MANGDTLPEHESIARIVDDKRNIDNKGRPKQRVFRPKLKRDGSRWEVSITRPDGMTRAELIESSLLFVERVRNSSGQSSKQLWGWAVLKVAAVAATSSGLSVIEDEPPVGHGVILGWRGTVAEDNAIAQLLASASTPDEFKP